MTMEELLASLTKKAKLECEEEHRQVVASLNGLAGLHIIREQVRLVGHKEFKERCKRFKYQFKTALQLKILMLTSAMLFQEH